MYLTVNSKAGAPTQLNEKKIVQKKIIHTAILCIYLSHIFGKMTK